MYLRTLLIVIVLGVIAVFAYLNWHVVVLPASLSLGFATVEAPLGLILLAVTAALTLLFLIYLVYLQSAALIESRRHARELQSQREIADNAEASRLKELRGFLELELQQRDNLAAETKVLILARLNEIERDLRATIEQTANSLAASIGEFEDRFERSSSGKN
jgi:uncharacterized integral membrane protein